MRKSISIVMAAMLLSGGAWASDVVRLGAEEAAQHGGATHLVIIRYSDLTETTDNTAQTLGDVFKVSAKMGVELVKAQLKTAFVDNATNAFNTTTVTVGDGTDADLYLTSMELNSNGTEVFLKHGNTCWGTASTVNAATNITLSTMTLTNVVGETTNTYTVVTNATLSTTAVMTADTKSYGYKVYTAADYVDFTFTPMASYDLAELDAGEVWFYLRVDDAR